MKKLKILLFSISIIFLFGCESEEPDITFDGVEFRYIGVTADDYLLYRNNYDDLEIMIDDENILTASYERQQDIFIIAGKEDSYVIRKNGTIIIACSGEELKCSGVETVSFSEDIDVLFDVFEEEGISTTLIVLGTLIVIASVSLFFVPKRFLEKIRIKNIKLGQLFILRLVTIIIIILGIVIIILSI